MDFETLTISIRLIKYMFVNVKDWLNSGIAESGPTKTGNSLNFF